MQLPDYPQIEQVRRRLWTGREVGRAAVMIGAGFSRNADPIGPSAAPFPLWNTLAERFYDALYPSLGPDSERARRVAQATANGGALRLASEYQIAFGRQSLDELVSRSVPDDSYVPGELHRALLALPWADVFTTNYDTLLERASRDVPERKYEIALTLADLPHATKPRIVKLHGSLPSHRPLVLTEEDYRTFPRRFAPFVNTVQQSLMENAFVLLGFSGEDPNFLEWTGWVRDNLGTSHPPIYLCGVLDLAPSARRFLEAQGIAPIDLAPIFPSGEHPSTSERHRKALQWFLLTLAAGAPADVIAWPRPIQRVAPAVEGLPPIPPGPAGLAPENPFPTDDYSISTLSEAARKEDLHALRDLWRGKREGYPGWLLLPQRNHDTLWHYTSHWIDLAAVRAAEMAPVEALSLVHELVWRLERLALPLPTSVVERVAALLEVVSPFTEHDSASQGGEINPRSPDHVGLPWERIRGEWMDLAFAWVRHARESGDAGQWDAWMAVL
ncbi:MAG TPA: SIR2 family protein, partial [Longimicrobium sp.]